MRSLLMIAGAVALAATTLDVAWGQPPMGTRRESGADRIQRQTYKDALQNSKDFAAKQRASWNQASGTASVRQATPPEHLQRCADAASAKHACTMVTLVRHAKGNTSMAKTLRTIADSLSIGPPTRCLAPADPPAVKLAAWGLYCGLSREEAMGLAEAVDPSVAAARKAKQADKARDADEARLARVRASFKALEEAREREKLELASEKRRTLSECDRGNIASCARFEKIALSPPAVEEKLWWHAIAQQCRMGDYAKCAFGAETARQAGYPKGWMELSEIGCLGGNAEQCATTAAWLVWDAKTVDRGMRMLMQGCSLGDEPSCDKLRESVEDGRGGPCPSLKKEKAVLKKACKAKIAKACFKRCARKAK